MMTRNNNPPVGDISGVTNPPHPQPGNPTTPPPGGVNEDAADTNNNKDDLVGKPKNPKNKRLVEQEGYYMVLFFVCSLSVYRCCSPFL
jgi:hypothetical protein